ncbi:hypothetical protein [Hyphomicrobium sp. 2TAF46]|uniref:hypothetical protein n=1 Tax=Hyphomicrobium sp. 2TAF46 TaxID=3233019 RepID=UPI003F936FCA
MKFVASVVVPVLALIAAHVPPAFADSAASAASDPQSAGTPPLPAFVPLSGQEKYASALQGKSGEAAAARQQAEKISALFAGMTTGSISKSDSETPVAASEAPSGRSIMLASNQSAEATPENNGASPKDAQPPAGQVKGSGKPHRIPQKAIARETHGSRIADGHEAHGPRIAESEPANLAAIGHKVSVLDLLTNPALWWH